MNSIGAHPDLFEAPVEIATKWNSQVALAGLEAAMTADPEIDFIFTSSDFLFPTIQSVLEPLGKWKKSGEEGHVILGGLDGDDGACKLIQEGYVDSTGVQDVYLEAELALDRHPGRDRGRRDAAERGQARSGLRAVARPTTPRWAPRPGAARSSPASRPDELPGTSLPGVQRAGGISVLVPPAHPSRGRTT